MLVSSIRLFSNSKINMGMNVESEANSLSRGAKRLSRILASETPKPELPRKRPPLTQAEKEKLERMRQQREAGQGAPREETPEPDNYPQ